MKIFFLWSGEISHKIALLFNHCLKTIFPSIETFISSEDIEKGAIRKDIIAKELKACSVGILFLTKENINSPWINFEAGALSNSFVNSRVIPFLCGVEKSEIRWSLARFQSYNAKKDEFQKFLITINNYSEPPLLKEAILIKKIEFYWQTLEKELTILLNYTFSETTRKNDDDMRSVDKNIVQADTIEIKAFMLEYFKKKAAMKGIYQKILTMDNMNKIRMLPEDVPWVQKTCEFLEQFDNKNWSNRKFRILNGQSVTKPISIFDYINACILADPPILYYTVKNIFYRFSKSCVSLLSIRDIFDDYDGVLEQENKEYFERMNLIDLPHPSESDELIPASNPPTVSYKGIIPEFLTKGNILYLFKKMDELRRIAVKMIEAQDTLSLSHIVLSHFHICSKKPVMIITASNTFKDRLKIFSETPIIIKEDDFHFYGEFTNEPSTETKTHWIIHSSMLKSKKNRFASIIHLHNETMTTIAEKSDIKTETAFVPTIPHGNYGTKDLGDRIVDAFNMHNTFAVTVKGHGQWFIGDTFEELASDIKKILREVKAFGSPPPRHGHPIK